MSTQYPGGFITKSPVAPTTTAASGIWTVDQALQYVKAGTWPSPPIFIEDLFSTYLYTGNGSTQTITNGIDLAGNGGLVWCKARSSAENNFVFDTVRGATKRLITNGTQDQYEAPDSLTAFTSSGFTLGGGATINQNGITNVSWTFSKRAKFFDVQTATSDAFQTVTFNHNLGVVPGMVILKCTAATSDWYVYHTSLGQNTYIRLNSTSAALPASNVFSTVSATQFVFQGTATPDSNPNSAYVAYFFASNAGGFPANGGGSTNGITCGSYTGNGSTSNQINLGYEPQWLLVKRSSASGNDWYMFDNMRGVYTSYGDSLLRANTTAAEVTAPRLDFNANGFSPTSADAEFNASGSTYIYIAVRRGPMKTPTVGTSVLGLNARTGTSAFVTVTGGLTDDLAIIKLRSGGALPLWATRLTGNNYVSSGDTSGETGAPDTILQTNPWDVMDGINVGSTSAMTNASTGTYINYLMRRAPGFMDVVCYEGINPSITHNLGVTPEMYIVKCRNGSGVTTGRWYVYHTGYNTSSNYIALNTTDALIAATIWGSGPTSSVIGASGGTSVNAAGQTYIAYLFATLAGISKVGSYTGTGALQTVNCGFTTGARFVLIKRTDSTGDWYTYDSARGMSSGTDPYFWMDSTAAENATTNYVDTDTTGFKVTAAAPAELNAVGGNYIFLAIA